MSWAFPQNVEKLWKITVLATTTNIMNAWDQIKRHLEDRLSPDAFRNWVARTNFRTSDGETLIVAAPDEATKSFLESEYSEAIHTSLRELCLPYRSVVFHLNDSSPISGGHGDTQPDTSLFQGATSQINMKFNFDNFVVGPCNQFAHAAAKAVAATPARSYNPLFIYGGVGMGKTHLMHAMGRALNENFNGMRIVYTTSERFMNQMINCIKLDRMQQFHQYFRSADALLIDDIQFLGTARSERRKSSSIRSTNCTSTRSKS